MMRSSEVGEDIEAGHRRHEVSQLPGFIQSEGHESSQGQVADLTEHSRAPESHHTSVEQLGSLTERTIAVTGFDPDRHEESGSQRSSLCCLLVCFMSQLSRWVRYQVLTVSLLTASAIWLDYYVFVGVHNLQDLVLDPGSSCDTRRDQLWLTARLLISSFLGFYATRLVMLLPAVSQAAESVVAGVRHDATGKFAFLLLLCVPMYLFCISALGFWLFVVDSSQCQASLPDSFPRMQSLATGSNIVSAMSLIVWYWRHSMVSTTAHPEEQDMSANGLTVDADHAMAKFETVSFDDWTTCSEKLRSHAECAICLCAWKHADIIKVLSCGHPFHEECCKPWFRTSRTCAVCRTDVISTWDEATRDREVPRAESQPVRGSSWWGWRTVTSQVQPNTLPRVIGIPFRDLFPRRTV